MRLHEPAKLPPFDPLPFTGTDDPSLDLEDDGPDGLEEATAAVLAAIAEKVENDVRPERRTYPSGLMTADGESSAPSDMGPASHAGSHNQSRKSRHQESGEHGALSGQSALDDAGDDDFAAGILTDDLAGDEYLAGDEVDAGDRGIGARRDGPATGSAVARDAVSQADTTTRGSRDKSETSGRIGRADRGARRDRRGRKEPEGAKGFAASESGRNTRARTDGRRRKFGSLDEASESVEAGSNDPSDNDSSDDEVQNLDAANSPNQDGRELVVQTDLRDQTRGKSRRRRRKRSRNRGDEGVSGAPLEGAGDRDAAETTLPAQTANPGIQSSQALSTKQPGDVDRTGDADTSPSSLDGQKRRRRNRRPRRRRSSGDASDVSGGGEGSSSADGGGN